MHTFEFLRPQDSAGAVRVAAQATTAQQGAEVRFLAGGTTLLDLMKLNVETPARLIDINRLPLATVEATPEGGLKIGATVRNSDLAHHPCVQRDYAVRRRPSRRRSPNPQHGDDGRQPPAADSMHVLPRHGHALQ
jgi:xanthine dehydrogenase YagS FAD-binding subunit